MINYGIIADLILLAIMVLSVAICAKRGLFKSISGIAGTVLGYIGGRLLSVKVAGLFVGFVRPLFYDLFSGIKVQQALTELAQKAAAGLNDIRLDLTGSGLNENTAELVNGVLDYMGATAADFSQMESSGTLAASLSDAASNAVAPVVAFILVFIVIKLAVSLVCSLLSADIPVIRDVDALGGVMLGLISGVITVTLLCWGVLVFAPEESVGFLSRQTMEQSIIGGFFATVFG
ncbi:MAG: CvpA family protein [Clostridia bacterium]|nr:CvpA family protein [Clostridia bacterium]